MEGWYEVSESECYRHRLTGVPVRVARVRTDGGFTGLVHWETLNGRKIDGVTSGVQEAQHFLDDFVHVSPAAAAA